MTDKPPLSQVLEALAKKTVECHNPEHGDHIIDLRPSHHIIPDPVFELLRIECPNNIGAAWPHSHGEPEHNKYCWGSSQARCEEHRKICPGWTTATESQAADAMGRMWVALEADGWDITFSQNGLDNRYFPDEDEFLWRTFMYRPQIYGEANPRVFQGRGTSEDSPWDAFYRTCAQAAEVAM